MPITTPVDIKLSKLYLCKVVAANKILGYPIPNHYSSKYSISIHNSLRYTQAFFPNKSTTQHL